MLSMITHKNHYTLLFVIIAIFLLNGCEGNDGDYFGPTNQKDYENYHEEPLAEEDSGDSYVVIPTKTPKKVPTSAPTKKPPTVKNFKHFLKVGDAGAGRESCTSKYKYFDDSYPNIKINTDDVWMDNTIAICFFGFSNIDSNELFIQVYHPENEISGYYKLPHDYEYSTYGLGISWPLSMPEGTWYVNVKWSDQEVSGEFDYFDPESPKISVRKDDITGKLYYAGEEVIFDGSGFKPNESTYLGLYYINSEEIPPDTMMPSAELLDTIEIQTDSSGRFTIPFTISHNDGSYFIVSDVIEATIWQEETISIEDRDTVENFRSDYRSNRKTLFETPYMPPILTLLHQINDEEEEIKYVYLGSHSFLILYGENKYYSANIAPRVIERLNELISVGKNIKSVSSADDKSWVILYGKNGYWAKNIPDSLSPVLKELNDDKHEIKQVVFSSDGYPSWVVLYDLSSASWNNISESLEAEIWDLFYGNKEIKNITMKTNYGEYSILYDRKEFSTVGLPESLLAKLGEFYRDDRAIKQITYNYAGWIILYGYNGYATEGMP